MPEIKRVTLKNGLKIYAFGSMDEIVEYVSSNKGILVAITALKILQATDETRTLINDNIGYCDGIGAVMALKNHGADTVKISGCELWLKLVEKFFPEGRTFYLVGGRQEVIDDTVAKLKKEYQGINIVGYRNGFLKNDMEKQALLEDISAKKPDVVFVAMGSPRQELLMMEMKKCHNAIYQGLGGSFDVYTGRVERSPQWWLDHNLEFAYRLLKQPSRIKHQILLPVFYILLKLKKI